MSNKSPVIAWSFLLSLLSMASCQGTSDEQAVNSLLERNSKAAHYRVVNLTGASLVVKSDGQLFSPYEQGKSSPKLRFAAGKNLVMEFHCDLAKDLTKTETLPERGMRSFYITVENGQIKSIPIDNDPMEPDSGPVVRGVNLSTEKGKFQAVVDGTSTDLGAPEPGTGASTAPSIAEGELTGMMTLGATTLKTSSFRATNDNSFSIVAYQDASGKTQVALVVNHVRPLTAGSASSAAGG